LKLRAALPLSTLVGVSRAMFETAEIADGASTCGRKT
jgi:hypothetical protein